MTEEINKYLESVRRQLKKAGDRDGEYFAVLRQDVDTYCAEHPLATAEDLLTYFGSPSSQAEEFLRNAPKGFTQQKLALRRRFFAFTKVVLAVLAAAIILLLSVLVIDTWSYTHGSVSESSAMEGHYEGSESALEAFY